MCLQYKSFKNTVGKEEIACNEQFLLFQLSFLPIWKTLYHFCQIWNCRLQTLSDWKSLKLVVWERVNSLPNDSFLTGPYSKHLQRTNQILLKLWILSWIGLKTLWEKEKMLVTSIFSFSHNVFKSFLFQGCLKSGLFGKGLMQEYKYKDYGKRSFLVKCNFSFCHIVFNPLPHNPEFNNPAENTSENIVGKGKNAYR